MHGLLVANFLDTWRSPRRALSKDTFSISFQPCTCHHAMHLVIGKAHRSQPHTKAGLDAADERQHNSTGARSYILAGLRTTVG